MLRLLPVVSHGRRVMQPFDQSEKQLENDFKLYVNKRKIPPAFVSNRNIKDLLVTKSKSIVYKMAAWKKGVGGDYLSRTAI